MALPVPLASQRCQANFRNAKNPATESLFLKLAGILLSDTEDLADSRVAGKSVWMGSGEGAPTGNLGTNIRGIYLREDAASIDAMVYVTVDGSTWAALKPGGLASYSYTVATPGADNPTAVCAAEFDDVAGKTFVGPFTDLDVGRNVSATGGADWAGGAVTVTGTDLLTGAAISETLSDPKGTTVYGTKVFKTVTAVTFASAGPGGGTHSCSIGRGHKFGLDRALSLASGRLTIAGADDPAVWDATYSAFSPTTLPDAAKSYLAVFTS